MLNLTNKKLFLFIFCSFLTIFTSDALNIVIAGGTGKVGGLLSSALSKKSHTVTILSRNVFLASAPSRVSSDFGWLGKSFLDKHPNVYMRDWDGGDLLDIVGCDWMGWQEDTLPGADIIINLVGGYTEQRVMATERIVRESFRLNKNALQITVSPFEEDIKKFSPGALAAKLKRIETCENMVKTNCVSSLCLRAELNDIKGINENILKIVENYKA